MASGLNRGLDNSDEYYDAQTSFRDILSKINNGQDLSSNEIQELPPQYQKYYFVTRDYPKKEQEMIRKNLKVREDSRMKEIEAPREVLRILRNVEDNILLSKDKHEQEVFHESRRPKLEQLQGTFKKLAGFQQLTKQDRDNLEYDYQRKKPRNEIQIDAAYVLDDIVQKKYTMEDIDRARGYSIESESDSPVQLFHQVILNSKKIINRALQTPKSGTYFNAIDFDLATRGSPLLVNEIVKQSVAGIEVLRGDPMEQNEAKAAIDSYVQATAMYEAETKILEAVTACETKQKQIEQLQPLAQSAAIAFTTTQKNTTTQILGFDITSEDYDISLTPSDDFDCYKPLEIISYIGMTNC